MKQFIAFVAFLAFGFSANAQSAPNSRSQDMVTMKDGKVILTNGGTMKELKADFTSANGNIFKPNGTVVLNTGVTEKLKNGESMTLDGKKIEATPSIETSTSRPAPRR